MSLPGPLWARLGLSGLPVGRRGVVMVMGAVPVVRPGRCLILMDKPSGLIVRPSLTFS